MVYFKYLTISFVNFTLIKLEGKIQQWKKSNGETVHWIGHKDCKSVYEKMFNIIEKCTLKPQWDITTYQNN